MKNSKNLLAMFGVPKHIAQKMVEKSNYTLQKTVINFDKRQFKIDQTKTSK